MSKRANHLPPSASRRLAHELRQGVVLLALTGSSVGGLLGMAALATRALRG